VKGAAPTCITALKSATPDKEIHLMTDILDLALDAAAYEFNDGTSLDVLVNKYLDILKPGQEEAALRLLVRESIGMVISANCLLDETRDESSTVADEIAAKLADAVIAQGGTALAVRCLAGEQIEHRAGVLVIMRTTKIEQAVPGSDEVILIASRMVPMRHEGESLAAWNRRCRNQPAG
jgi:hypothetical protein